MPQPTYHIDISNSIGWWGFTKHDAQRGLRNAPSGEVQVRLSSLGGSLDDGLDIRRQFADHGNVTIHLVGMTASAATVLAMGARRIVMSRGASLLIHNSSLYVSSWGSKNKEEVDEDIARLRATHGTLETFDRVMADIYAARTGRSVEEMAALMSENRWLSAEEALAFGLVDELADDLVSAPPTARASAFTEIAALGLPPLADPAEDPEPDAPAAAEPEEPEAAAAAPSLLRQVGTALQELGRKVTAAFEPAAPPAASLTEPQPRLPPLLGARRQLPQRLHRPLLHALPRRAHRPRLPTLRMDRTMTTSAPDESLQEFSREWYDMMTRIWRDRIALLSIHHTGALAASIQGAGLALTDHTLQADFRFLDYGLAVDAGTGKYYDTAHRDRHGHLTFLSSLHRHQHNLHRKRQPRPWFSISWAVSRSVLAERYALTFGNHFYGLFDNLEK